jgi:L-rhamnose isomerase
VLKKIDRELVQRQYEDAESIYGCFGVDVKEAMKLLSAIPLSLHCWQGDDVGGFESGEGLSGGGILATGNYYGKPRTADELREDAAQAFSLIPGKHRFNLHAIYAETGGKSIERDRLEPEHFSNWIGWAKEMGIGLDMNPTFFSHPLAEDGFTLAHRDKKVRSFWVRHGIVCRKLGAAFGRELGTPCVTNIWIPDGYKDRPADRLELRKLLKDSLDAILEPRIEPRYNLDAVEGKLFGIGSEAYVVGSHDFYLAYAMQREDLVLCLDTGHFHPTESVADKLSAILPFKEDLLLHVSRPVRWDSDHVVIVNDDLMAIAEELKRAEAFGKVRLGLDYFDASINRIAAWVAGARATLRTILGALLEPTEMLKDEERKGNLTNRLALMEELKRLPAEAVWNEYCLQSGVPPGWEWIDQVWGYDAGVLSKR